MAKLNFGGYSLDNFSEKNFFYDRVMRCNNVYPFYGIDEFDKVDINKLKKVAQLRNQIRKAEFISSQEVVEEGWEKLKQVMIY